MTESSDGGNLGDLVPVKAKLDVKADATEALNTATQKAAEVVDDFRDAEKVATGWLRELVGWGTEAIAEHRLRSIAKMKHRTGELLAERGIDNPRVLPPAVLPQLAEASFVEDENLQELWAGLIADAMDPKKPGYSPSFGRALLEFGRAETRVLQVAALLTARQRDELGPAAVEEFREVLARVKNIPSDQEARGEEIKVNRWADVIRLIATIDRGSIEREAGLPKSEVADAIAVLLRTNILEGARPDIPFAIGGSPVPPTAVLPRVILTEFGCGLYRRTTGDAEPLLPEQPE